MLIDWACCVDNNPGTASSSKSNLATGREKEARRCVPSSAFSATRRENCDASIAHGSAAGCSGCVCCLQMWLSLDSKLWHHRLWGGGIWLLLLLRRLSLTRGNCAVHRHCALIDNPTACCVAYACACAVRAYIGGLIPLRAAQGPREWM